MDSKSLFMGGLCLKPMPKIVTKNDNKITNRSINKKLFEFTKHSKNSNLNSLIENHQSNSILSSNLSNQNCLPNNQNQPLIKNKIQFIKHAENILKQRPQTQKSISLLQKAPVKMQSLLHKRSILNTMNSNLIANQYNSNLLINSLMKTTTNSSLNNLNYQQEKIVASSSNHDQARVDDKMIKVIKLCVTKLEFSSPLFRRIATKMCFLYIKPTYDHVRNYERFCGTSNKALLKQVMNKGHTLKYKPSRSRSRMLRSNEIIDGKVMISWQRGNYVHVYTFNRRQRLRRYRQISMDLGFEHRTLQIMYGLKKVTLAKIIDCPFCKKKLNPDLGHYCVVARKTTTTKRLKSNKASILDRSHQQVKLNNSVQTSDYISQESDNSLDLAFTSNRFTKNKRSLLQDNSKINLHKLTKIEDYKELQNRCPTLLLDSSNYKNSNSNSISNVIVRRMDSKELNKNTINLQKNKQNHQQQIQSSSKELDKLKITKVNGLPVKNSIKFRVIDQHNFSVSSLENSIKIVFK